MDTDKTLTDELIQEISSELFEIAKNSVDIPLTSQLV